MRAVLANAGEARPAAPGDERARDVLTFHAGILASMLAERSAPPSWRDERFVGDVARVRAHLALLTNRVLLVDSFRRESAYLMTTRHLTVADAEGVLATSTVDVAYAIRWVELTRPPRPLPWAEHVACPTLPLAPDG